MVLAAIVVAVSTLTIVSSVLLPILVGIVTKEVANPALKAILLALFAAASGVISSGIDGNGLISDQAVTAALISWVVAVSSYYGFLKPTGVAPAVARKTRNIGVG